jgi:SAM-dependent methyltransferase
MPWPLPALLTWALAWVVFVVSRLAGLPFAAAAALATLVGAAAAVSHRAATTRWRVALLVLGFPVSLLATGVAPLPAWAWLLPLALLLLLYPLRSWRDAPLFPTPRGALAGLPLHVPVPEGGRIVDAGCGLGDGLIELRNAYPRAHLEGLEWSWPLRMACALRCSFARVRRADIWAADWSAYQLVYLFQRPESMARAAQKAARELSAGAWLVSLEFEVPSCRAQVVHHCPDGRKVYAYRAPLQVAGS